MCRAPLGRGQATPGPRPTHVQRTPNKPFKPIARKTRSGLTAALASIMSEFRIYSGGALVGTSTLEHGDPPMGVAFGRFMPAAGYAAIQAECQSNHRDQSSLRLSVVTPSGETISCAGVGILEGSGDIEVNVLGISRPEYAELFPQHIAQYEASVK